MHEPTSPIAAAVGYLFTDIDASTQKWERTPREMAIALARHDEITDAVIARHGGVIHDRAGDGVFALFPSDQALACALEIQLALEECDWSAIGGLSVRVGVHAGPARTGREIDRVSANRAARIMASGWGGQIVVSSAAAAAFSLPHESELADLGLCRLKGIDEPLRLFGLTHPRLKRVDFPPLRSISSSSLVSPAQAAPIYGRDRELAAIEALISDGARRLTIVGPGGNGKTRLALEAAGSLSQRYAVYFVSLEQAESGSDLWAALAASMRFPIVGRQPLEAQLLSYFADKEAVIVLDNADRFAGKFETIEMFEGACPGVKFLVTSREPLGGAGETTFRLRGLGAPSQSAFLSAPSAMLFTQAARALEPNFSLDEDDWPAFHQLCEAVDGSPLALHLTAQWTQVLPLHDIVARVRGGVSFLAGIEDPRYRLQNVFDGSWDLLSEPQRRALTTLAVFDGGFDAAAAEAVAQVEPQTLAALERKCLVERSEKRRFVMHPLIREYAGKHLAEDPAAAATVRRAHRGYFLALARDNFAAARGAEQGRLLEIITKESANLRSAWVHAITAGDAGGLREFVEPLFYTFVFRAMFREGAELFSTPAPAGPLQNYLLSVLANCLVHQGEFEKGEALARQALADGEADAALVGHAYQALANSAHARGDWALARLYYERALSSRAALGDDIGASFSAISLAWLHLQTGDLRSAKQWVQESFRLCQRSGNVGGVLIVHACAGELAQREGRFEDAHASYAQALKVEEQVHQPQQRSSTLIKLGHLHVAGGDFGHARTVYEEALAIAKRSGDQRIAINASLGLSCLRRLARDYGLAREETLAALRQSNELKLPVQSAAAHFELARVALASGEAGEAARSMALGAHLGTPGSEAELAALRDQLPPGYSMHVVENYEEEVSALLNASAFGVLRI